MWQEKSNEENTPWVEIWDSYFKELTQKQIEGMERELAECPAFARKAVTGREIRNAVRTMGMNPKRPQYPNAADLIGYIQRGRREDFTEKQSGLKSCGLCDPYIPGHQYGKIQHKKLGYIQVLVPCCCELGIQVAWDLARQTEGDTPENKEKLMDLAARVKTWRLNLPDTMQNPDWIYNPRIRAALSQREWKGETEAQMQEQINRYIRNNPE